MRTDTHRVNMMEAEEYISDMEAAGWAVLQLVCDWDHLVMWIVMERPDAL